MVGGNARARGVADGRCMLGKADMHEPPPRGSVVFCLAFLPELRIVLLMHLAVVDVMIKAVHGVVGCSARRGAEQRCTARVTFGVRVSKAAFYENHMLACIGASACICMEHRYPHRLLLHDPLVLAEESRARSDVNNACRVDVAVLDVNVALFRVAPRRAASRCTALHVHMHMHMSARGT